MTADHPSTVEKMRRFTDPELVAVIAKLNQQIEEAPTDAKRATRRMFESEQARRSQEKLHHDLAREAEQ